VIVVNECDRMSEGAAFAWLDILEALPPRCLFIFTTNDVHRLPSRFRDRCESFAFKPATPPTLAAYVQRVWTAEGKEGPAPTLAGASFRRALQELAPILRAGGEALASAVEDQASAGATASPTRSPWWTVAALALAGLAAVAVILATGASASPNPTRGT
jgi:DNA polymerase III delta prime subunit